MNPRPVIFCILAMLYGFSLPSRGQVPDTRASEGQFRSREWGIVSLRLRPEAQPSLALTGTSSLLVLDARSDSFALGFTEKGTFWATTRRIVPEFGLAEMAQQYMHSLLLPVDTAGSSPILLCIRRLWLSEEEIDEDSRPSYDFISGRRIQFNKTICTARLEFYRQRGASYCPLIRVDTTICGSQSLREGAGVYLQWILAEALSRLSAEADLSGKHRHLLSIAEIQQFNGQPYQVPILADSNYPRGVFLTFDEFRNNAPSIRDFQVNRTRHGEVDVVYIRSADNQFRATRDLFGYSDGKQLFLRYGNTYCPLKKIQESFYFMGLEEIRQHREETGVGPYDRGASGGSLYNGRPLRSFRPRKLDLADSKVY
jgi:hypothetical protein